MKLQYLDLHTLSHELNTKVACPSRLITLIPKLKRFGSALLHWLLAAEDVHIRQVTRSGEIGWLVFDRATHTEITLNSEMQVREYLERRYH